MNVQTLPPGYKVAPWTPPEKIDGKMLAEASAKLIDLNGGEPALEAYAIEHFSSDGNTVNGCNDIPTAPLEFFPDFNGDNAYLYIGAESTTTFPVTTTVPG